MTVLRYLVISLCLGLVGLAQAESLYSSATFKPLIMDKRAYRVGDTLTVLVSENASAITSADTDLDRTSDVSVGVATNISSQTHAGELTFGNNTTGKGKTARSGRLQAQITVSVIQVEPNGDLQVTGSKEIEVNREQQIFRINGRVRRADVGTDNTVASSRLADVKILFSGTGDISDKQRPGLISRVLDWLGLP